MKHTWTFPLRRTRLAVGPTGRYRTRRVCCVCRRCLLRAYRARTADGSTLVYLTKNEGRGDEKRRMPACKET